jgi:hypothetical protein
VQALNNAAKGGDVQAAGQLLKYMHAWPHVDTETKLEEQPAFIRERLLRRLIRHEEAVLRRAGLRPDGVPLDRQAGRLNQGPGNTAQGL